MASVNEDIQQMQDQINQYGSVTQFGIRVQSISGPGAQEGDTGFISTKTGGGCSGGGGEYDASWQVGNWGDTMTFTPR